MHLVAAVAASSSSSLVVFAANNEEDSAPAPAVSRGGGSSPTPAVVRVVVEEEKMIPTENKRRSLVNPDDDKTTCFSAVSQAQVLNKGWVAMKDLQVGDQVLTRKGRYEPVYAFGHNNPTKSAEFFQIHHTTEAGSSKAIEMTASHLVFLDGKTNPVRADTIKVGDILKSGGDGTGGKVTKIESVLRDGIYGPWTPDGTIVVDGIVASSYASFQDHHKREFVEFQGGFSFPQLSMHRFIHMASSPFRVFCMGISSNLCNVYNEDGIPLIASAGGDFVLWVDQQNILIQVLFFVVVGSLAALSLLVENIFGPSYGPLVVLAAGVGFYKIIVRPGSGGRKVKVA